MPIVLLLPRQVDDVFGWKAGKAEKLARAGKIDHIRINPTGEIRFEQHAITSMLRRVHAETPVMKLVAGSAP